jgi:hypothetical protein
MTGAHWRLGVWLFAFFGGFTTGAVLWGWGGFIFAWLCLAIGFNLHNDMAEIEAHEET